jgi:hypothetical protein
MKHAGDTVQYPTRSMLTQRIRDCRQHNIVDQTGVDPGDAAIYTLSDPRDVRLVRYVGQTRNPQSRFTQHLHAARLWMPDELPWWIREEKLRPLYTWIRELHGDGGRLPVMFVVGWTTAQLARRDERRFVREFVAAGLPLLNHEADAFDRRLRRVR